MPRLPGCTCAEIVQSVAIVVAVCARFVDFAHMVSMAAAGDGDVYSAAQEISAACAI